MRHRSAKGRTGMEHDIFISYRREGGFETAHYLYEHLTRDGYGVTFDLDTLRSGRFDEALLQRIDECTDFVVVLNKGCFDRTLDPAFPSENDWLRRELGHALGKKKNVIPVLLAGFEFPEGLPEDIAEVRFMNGPAYSREYLDEFYKRLKEYLRTVAPKAGGSLEGGKAERGPIPSTVALPSRVFVGREGVPEALHRLLSAGRIPVVTGPGGTGKSELAFHYAAAFREEYPGGLFQIDMETAKSWDDALQRLLLAPGLDMRAILGLNGSDGTRELSAADIAGGLRWRAEQAGRILLVLDNVVSAKAFLREPVLAGLSLPPEVAAVATARTLDVLFRPTDRAVEFPLADLSPEAALELLLKDNPAESDAERAAAGNIARLLDFRALHLRAVPALLDDPYSSHAGSYVSLEAALRENLQKTVEDAMADYGEGSRTPTALWVLTRETLGRYPMGEAWIKLAHIAAFLSPEGFRESSLRHLWNKLVASKETPERAFGQALDVLRRHGLLDKTEDGFRMHRLTAAAARNDAGDAAVPVESLSDVVADYAWKLLEQHDFDESRRLYETALDIYRNLAVMQPAVYELIVADTLAQLAILHGDTQRLGEAESEYGEALEIYRRRSAASSGSYERHVASTLFNLANFHADMLRLAEAESEYLEALEIYRRLSAKCPGAYEWDEAGTLNNLASLYRDTQRHEEAESAFLEVLEILRRLAEGRGLKVRNADVAKVLNNLADLHSDMQRHDESAAEYSEALEIYRRLEAENPAVYAPAVAWTLTNLAILHDKTQRHEEAEAEYREALEIYRRLAVESPEANEECVGRALNGLAILHVNAQRHEEAEPEFLEALEFFRRVVERSPAAYKEVNMLQVLENLATLHRNTQRYKEAEAEYQEALEISRRLAVESPAAYGEEVGRALDGLAILHAEAQRHEDAESEFLEALEIWRRLAARNPEAYEADVATTLNNLAVLHMDTQRLAEAEAECKEALEIRRRLAAVQPAAYEPGVAATQHNMALLFEKSGKNGDALAAARESLTTYGRCAERNPARFEDDLEDARSLVTRLEEET